MASYGEFAPSERRRKQLALWCAINNSEVWEDNPYFCSVRRPLSEPQPIVWARHQFAVAFKFYRGLDTYGIDSINEMTSLRL
jgi:hypothetical protein